MRRARLWRGLGLVALAGVLGLAFAGYLSPEVRASWETLAAMCGF